MNLPQFKIRASQAGRVMTNPRNKGETLSETTKTYVKEWLAEKIYGYKKQIKSKYLDKGNALEDLAIDTAIQMLDLPMVLKNEQYFENEHFCGTPDLIVDGVVYDIKNSWDCFTFPLFETECPNKDYFYQLQVYMHLTGCNRAVLTYVLLNTPEHMTWEDQHDYDGLDDKYRIKTFEFEYQPEVIQDLEKRVLNIREYITTLNF